MELLGKMSHELMVEAGYSKYGILSGVLSQESDKVCCGVICEGWPSLALGAIMRGWEIKLIIIKANFWSSEIVKLFPAVPVWKYDECENRLGLMLEVDVWISNVDPPRRLRLFEARLGYIIVTARRARRASEDFQSCQRLSLSHVQCRGATNGTWNFYIYQVLFYGNAFSYSVLHLP